MLNSSLSGLTAVDQRSVGPAAGVGIARPADRGPSWRRLGWVFLLVYALSLLIQLPASLLVNLAQPALQARAISLTPQQVEGTLWHGRIHAADALRGLNGVGWQWQPQRLLQGALGVELVAGAGVVRGEVALSAFGRLLLDNVRLDGRLAQLILQLDGVPLLSDAQLSGIIDGAVFSAQGCEQLAQGQLLLDQWSGFAATSLNQLQGVRITLRCEQQLLLGAIAVGRDEAGFAGELSLAADGRYQLRLSAQPRIDEMQQLFENLGFRRQGGALVVTRSGQLPL